MKGPNKYDLKPKKKFSLLAKFAMISASYYDSRVLSMVNEWMNECVYLSL